MGLEREVLMQRLAPELDNLRAAIRWGLSADAEIAFGLIWVAGVCRQAPASELRHWVDDALANAAEVDPARRVKVIRAAGNLANANQEPERARDLYEQTRDLYREIGDQRGVAWTLAALALVASRQGDVYGARRTYAKSLALYTSLENTAGQWLVLNHLGRLETSARNFDRARPLLEQAVELATADCDTENLATSIHGLGDLALETGDAAAAGGLYREAISLSAGLTAGWPNIRICLAGLAAVAGARGDAETAGVLWGAAESLEKHLAMPLWPDERASLPQDAGGFPAKTAGGGRRDRACAHVGRGGGTRCGELNETRATDSKPRGARGRVVAPPISQSRAHVRPPRRGRSHIRTR